MNCSVENQENLIDSDPETFATMHVTSLLGGAAVINADFESPFDPDPSGPKWPAGSIAGYVVEFPGIVDASVLPTFSIVTKLDNVFQEEFKFSGILGAEFLASAPSGGPFFIGVTTHKDYDFVEFKITTGLASVMNTVNLYAACGNGDEQTSLPYNVIGASGP